MSDVCAMSRKLNFARTIVCISCCREVDEKTEYIDCTDFQVTQDCPCNGNADQVTAKKLKKSFCGVGTKTRGHDEASIKDGEPQSTR